MTNSDDILKFPQLYWDNFADEVITETEDIAPPERYTRLYCGTTSDLYVEKWQTNDGRYIQVAYGTFARKRGLVWLARKDVEETNNIRLSVLTEWTVPEEHYKKFIDSLSE